MPKHKIEKHYVITYRTREDGARMLDLLNEDGPVQGIDCGGTVGVVASESQLKRLTEEGVEWGFVDHAKKQAAQNGKEAADERVAKAVRTAAHRR
jgi:hypothetical protein